jgi:hypothetical protein
LQGSGNQEHDKSRAQRERRGITKKKLQGITKEQGSNSEEHYNKLVSKFYDQGPDYHRLVGAGITAYNINKQNTMKLYDDAMSTL